MEWYGLHNDEGGFGFKYEFYPDTLLTFNQDKPGALRYQIQVLKTGFKRRKFKGED